MDELPNHLDAYELKIYIDWFWIHLPINPSLIFNRFRLSLPTVHEVMSFCHAWCTKFIVACDYDFSDDEEFGLVCC